MARALLSGLSLAALVASALGCAVPHGGCRKEVCAKYAGVTVASVDFPGADYNNPDTWLKGSLPLIGYYLGIYNKQVNGGGYNRAGIKDTPALNYERFDLQAAYATASSETSIEACCNKCAAEDGCYLFQFFPPDTPSSYAPSQCYLLKGGSSTWDWPERGTPYAGSYRRQTTTRASIPPSFVGGRCNGTGGVIDDPHFTGARGTRFDFNGELGRAYCLTSDRNLHINALLRGYRDTNTQGATVGADGKGVRSWIREVAFLWKDAQGAAHTLHLQSRSGKAQERGAGYVAKITLDGAEVPVPSVEGAGVEKGDLSLMFAGVLRRGAADVEQYSIKIGSLLDLSLAVRPAHPRLQAADDSEVHFNLLINELRTTDAVHGVLGQTYRNTPQQEAKAVKYAQLTQLLEGPIQADGETGKGFLEGDVHDYVTSSATAPDCKFSAFL